MGRWTLERITGTTSPYISETVGHNVKVTYQLRYDTSVMGKFVELPILEWNEQIYMIEHHNDQWWEFEANMYRHNPLSKTLEVWAKRYIAAFDQASGRAFMGKGSARLMTSAGRPVQARDLGNASTASDKADRVRSYLKKHGGKLELTIHDIPSINKPDANTHKERLLVFNCGFAGGGARWAGAQYLNMDGATSIQGWVTDFQPSAGVLSQTFQRNTVGMRKVPPPPLVANARQALFASGECW